MPKLRDADARALARFPRMAAACALALCLAACQQASYPYYVRSRMSLDKDTSVVLYFDSSGSMEAVLPPLQEMIAPGGRLYEGLHRIYGEDYDKRVVILQNDSENTLAMLALEELSPRPKKCVVFVIQDENDFSEDVDPVSPWFLADMRRLQDRIDGEFSLYRGVVVQIVHPDIPDTIFEALLRKWEGGIPPYEGEDCNFARYATALPPKIRMLYRIPFADAAYYGDLVLSTLADMGIRIPD